MGGNIAPQYPSPIQRPVSTFQHLQRMPPPQNLRMQPNCAPIQHLINKSQTANNYFVSNAGKKKFLTVLFAINLNIKFLFGIMHCAI